MSIEESEAIYNAQSHQRSKRDVIDIIISGIELIPGVPNLPYRKMLQALNPLKFKVGGDLKGNIKLRKGNVDVTSVVGVRMGILGRMAGVAVGSKGSIGKDGLGFNYGGTIGFGSKKLPDGALANGDTNVPYAKYNSNNITA